MSRTNLSRWISGLAGAAAMLLANPATGAAQCIMCYLSASSSGARGAHVLRMGIIVLAVPTLLTFAGIFLLAYRRRNPAGWTNDSPSMAPKEADSLLPLPAEQQSHSPSVY